MAIKSYFQNYKIQNILFDIMWVLFIGCRIFDISAWGALNYVQYFNFFRILKYLLAALCLAVIILHFIHREYTWRAVAGYVLLGGIILLSARYSDNHTFIWYYLMFAAAYHQDAERILFLSASVTGIMLVFIVGTSLVGIGIDYVFDAGIRSRHGLGFGWTTSGPVLYFFFLLQYIFLRKEKMRWPEYIVLEGIAVFFFVLTNTNLTFFFSTGILLFMFVEGRFKNRWRFWSRWKWFWILLPVIVCAAAFAMYFLYDGDISFWSRLNSAMHNRLTLGQNGIREYGITLFGQPISWHGYYITELVVPDYNYIDCSYLQLFLEFGAAFLAAVLAIYTVAMYRAVTKNQYYLVWILAAVLVFSVMEPRLMDLIYNVFPIVAFAQLARAPLQWQD